MFSCARQEQSFFGLGQEPWALSKRFSLSITRCRSKQGLFITKSNHSKKTRQKNLDFCCFFSLSLFGLLPGAEVVDEDRAVLDVDFAGDETVLGQLVLQAIQPGHLKKRTISLNINKKDLMFRRPYQCPVDGFVAVALRPVPGAVLAVGGGGADGGLKRAKSTSNTTYVDQGRAKDEELGLFQRQPKKHNAIWLSCLIAQQQLQQQQQKQQQQ